MALLKPYCSLAQVQTECRNTDERDVQSFVDSINAASRYIESVAQRDFWFHDHATDALVIPPSWCAESIIYLPWPVLTLTEIKVAPDSGPSEFTMLPADYRFENVPLTATGKIYRTGRWLARDAYSTVGLLPQKRMVMPNKIMLKGTFGYKLATDKPLATPPADIPAEINRACVVMASIWSGKAHRQIVAEGGMVQTVLRSSVPKEINDMIGRYRLPVV